MDIFSSVFSLTSSTLSRARSVQKKSINFFILHEPSAGTHFRNTPHFVSQICRIEKMMDFPEDVCNQIILDFIIYSLRIYFIFPPTSLSYRIFSVCWHLRAPKWHPKMAIGKNSSKDGLLRRLLERGHMASKYILSR